MMEAVRGERPEPDIKYRPFILAVVGLPLHGKTTLATELARTSNLTLLDVDKARAGLFPERVIGQTLPPDQERFVMLTSYQSVHEEARDILQRGKPVVIAGAYTRRIYHKMLQDLAKSADVPLRVALLECSEDKIKARIQKRNNGKTLSNVRTFEQYANIRDRYERIGSVIVLNSGQRINKVAVGLAKFLQKHVVT